MIKITGAWISLETGRILMTGTQECFYPELSFTTKKHAAEWVQGIGSGNGTTGRLEFAWISNPEIDEALGI